MKCIEKLKKYCVENGIVSENKAEWFQYGVERRLTTLVVGVPFYILALALTNVSTSVAFFLSFYFLRCRINGFHAKSVLACLFISLLCEIFFLTIVYYLLTPIVMVSINLVGILLVFWLAPFTDSSFPLTSKEFHSVKRSGKSRILALTIIMCISMAFGKYEFAKGVTTGIAMAVFLLSLAYIIQGGKNMNKQQENVKRIVSNLVSKMIDRDTYEWPPKCTFITYQPKRPNRLGEVTEKKNR